MQFFPTETDFSMYKV